MPDTVSFTRMIDGTAEDYAITVMGEAHLRASVADNVLDMMRRLTGSFDGYQVDRLTHCLQTATRAERDGADEELVVCALLHDIGDILAPVNHADFAASILKPYITPENHWLVRHHAVFQLAYYGHHLGLDPNARERYRDNPNYERTRHFCEHWDQESFDPAYDTLPLEHFEPAVRRVFARTPFALWPGRQEFAAAAVGA